METFRIPVSFELRAVQIVEAETLAEAVEKALYAPVDPREAQAIPDSATLDLGGLEALELTTEQ